MSVPQWCLLVGLAIFLVVSVNLLRKIIPALRARNPAAARGKPGAGARYSLTGAMMPWKKESARLYPASYILGVLYHMGTFLCFIWVAIVFFGVGLPRVAVSASLALISLSAVCGMALLVKRIVDSHLRFLSNPDDYFSNLLVTGWQVVTGLSLLYPAVRPALLVWSGALLAYIPVGKLRHAIYFVPARLYLGIFYGRRGIWPAGGRG
jgi:nitrate reductase gamma subunit